METIQPFLHQTIKFNMSKVSQMRKKSQITPTQLRIIYLLINLITFDSIREFHQYTAFLRLFRLRKSFSTQANMWDLGFDFRRKLLKSHNRISQDHRSA